MILNPNGLKIIILFQHLLQVRSLIEYLPRELCVGNNLPVPIVLQSTRADIQYSRSHTSLPVRKCSPPNSGLCVCATSFIRLLTLLRADSTTRISSASMFKSLTDSIVLLFYLLFFDLSDFICNNCSTSSRL